MGPEKGAMGAQVVYNPGVDGRAVCDDPVVSNTGGGGVDAVVHGTVQQGRTRLPCRGEVGVQRRVSHGRRR